MKPLLLALGVLVALTAVVAMAAGERQRLLDRRRALQWEMTQTRVRLLRDKDELRELHQRIRNLEALLAEKLDAQPEMVELREELAAVEAEFEALPAP